jgi:superfamily II DNA helicase RecQ
MIVRFALPERLARASEDQIGFPSSGPLQPLKHAAGPLPRPDQHMNVIAHYYEGAQIVHSLFTTAAKSFYYQIRHFQMFQEHRSQPGGIQITVHPHKRFASR